jgi:23S rRNA pseudouridine2605 synthase
LNQTGSGSDPDTVRLQKFLAESGVGSRRASEQFILAGRVRVNGQIVNELGTKVHPGRDEVQVDGMKVKPRRKIYVALNKPRGYICTRRDPADRRIVSDLLPAEWHHLHSVGRLDRDTEGLIFLTNDGQFSLCLTHPRYAVRKTYRVTVEGCVEPPLMQKYMRGVTDEGEKLKAEKARILSANNTSSILELELMEGKNREIRRLCAGLDLKILRLQRTRIGPIRLGELPEGKWRILTEAEINSLLPAI